MGAEQNFFYFFHLLSLYYSINKFRFKVCGRLAGRFSALPIEPILQQIFSERQ